MSATATPPLAPEAPPSATGKGGKADARKQSAVKITLSGEPTVQLLPPSIRDRSLVRSRIRTGVLLVVLGAVVAGGLVAVGTLRTAQAEAALQQANDLTTELLAQQAQYTDAVKIDALVKQIEELQLGATSTEIDWAALVRLLLAKLPEGGQLLEVTAVGVAPWQQTPLIGEEGTPELAVLSLRLSTLTIQEATAYSRSLAELDGFASATISQVAVDVDGRVSTQLTLALTTGAESGRFATDDEAEEGSEEPARVEETAEDPATDDAATDDAADEPSDEAVTDTEED